MTRIFALLSLFALAACGADGAPEAPEPGVTISGQAGIGVKATL